jgi:glucose-1-phosphate cytidylyltransferase
VKVVLLAGGLGTRLSEETDFVPKPMVEVGGRPILWHVLKSYYHFGYNDFVVCLGYKVYHIKDYFHHYYMLQADVTIDLERNPAEYHSAHSEPWRLTLVDTGLNTMTGGRLSRVRSYLGDDTFMMIYGDGLAGVDIHRLVGFHRDGGRLATLTAVRPRGCFGAVEVDEGNLVTRFQEKPDADNAWISGGFFVLEPGVFDYIREGDETIWEQSPLASLARDGELDAYQHQGFWMPMDTLRDKRELESLWQRGAAPWKSWDET